MEAQTLASLTSNHGERLAYHFTPGKTPGVVFMGGFRSDMSGSKALFLEERCRERGQQFLRFDYSGHGQSGGDFKEGSISRWLEDTLTLLDAVTSGPQVLVGSSMGGWIMLLAARARASRIAGLVGIAAAPDFTEDLMWNMATPEQKRELLARGILYEPSQYSDQPTPITLQLIEDGRKNLILRTPFPTTYPVRLLHGMNDPDVPWQRSVLLAETMSGPDIQVLYQPQSDHRFSSPEDLAILWETVETLL